MRILKVLALTSILALPLTAMADPDTRPAPTAPAAGKTAKTSAHRGAAKHSSKSGKRHHKATPSK